MLQSVMAELTEKFSGPTELDATFQSVTSACVDLIPGVDFADVLLIAGAEQFQSIAATEQLATQVDDLQQQFREGPCLDAALGDGMVRSNDLGNEARWPRFARAAVQAGVASMLSFHLYTHKTQLGALNMFGRKPDGFGAEAETLGAMLATHAAIAVMAANKEHQFRSALASRDIIGQAKGMVMERFNVDAVRAFELLTKLSQDTNTRVADIAADIVARAGSHR
jgi:transcriptional regulator with GAF, ATPase, and Fis domain